jgi:nitroreductase
MMSEAFDAILGQRHSCRAFLPRPVERPIIERLLTMAQRAPSWCNTQPWQVIITQGEATRLLAEGLSQHAASGAPAEPDIAFPASYNGIYQQRRRVCGYQLYDAVGIARGDRPATTAQAQENFRFFGAPNFALITTDAELGPYGAIDCGGYLAVFLMAAQALGLSAIPQAAVAAYSPWLRSYFALPTDRLVVCGVSFGYAQAEHSANRFRTARAPLEEVVQWHGEMADHCEQPDNEPKE